LWFRLASDRRESERGAWIGDYFRKFNLSINFL
jgi:hypothetical protein